MDSIHLAEFVGLPSSLGWSHVITASTGGAECVICFSVSGMQASAVGHEMVAHLRAASLSTEQELYDAIISLNSRTQERSCQLSVAAGFVTQKKGSWIVAGGVVGLQRNGRFGRVLASQQLEMRTGSLKAGDVFVLATSAAAGMIDDVAELFNQGYQLTGIESSLDRLIRTQPQQDRSALVLIQMTAVVAETVEDSFSEHEPIQSMADVNVLQIERQYQSGDQHDSGEFYSGGSPVGEDSGSEYSGSHLNKGEEQTAESSSQNVEHAGSASSDIPGHTSADTSSDAASRDVATASSRSNLVAAAGGKLQGGLRAVGPALSSIGTGLRRAFGKMAMLGQGSLGFATRGAKTLSSTARQVPWRAPFATKKARIITLVVVGAIVVLLAAILTIRWQQGRSAAVAAGVVEPWKVELQGIQARAATDPLRAQSDLNELATTVSEAIIAKPEKAVLTALQSLLAEIRLYEDVLKGEQAVRSLPIFMDLQAVVPGFVTTYSDGVPGTAFYIDTAKKIGILVNFETQQTTQFDLASLEKIQALTLRSASEAIILGNGLYKLDLSKVGAPVAVKPVGDSNRAATLIGSYENYVYLFNPEKRNIFRHLIRKDGYSDPIGWLLSPLTLPADMVHSLKVDGDVWLSTKDGQIKKFTSGRSTSFALTNLEQPLEGPVQVYTTAKDQYLYAFVPTQQRVVQLTKDGVFVKQIKSEVLSGAHSVAVDEVRGNLFAVSGSVIYQAKL